VYTKKCLEGQESDACTPVVEEIIETQTDFIAETLLPTHRGDYRVRAYRHWVSASSSSSILESTLSPTQAQLRLHFFMAFRFGYLFFLPYCRQPSVVNRVRLRQV
jgi:hypothetical protein